MALEPVFISRRFFGKGESKKKPREPAKGPQFVRPDGSRDPAAENRINLLLGVLSSWGC